MTAIARVARACVLADHEFLCVNALVGLTAVAASGLLLHYGSFARALAAFGLAPAI
jgi:hypothetical protein